MSEQLDKYEILEKIGEGGFAIVHRGRDTSLDRLVAMKELRPILLNDTDWVRRFHREAQTIARLDHPNIVTIQATPTPVHNQKQAETLAKRALTLSRQMGDRQAEAKVL